MEVTSCVPAALCGFSGDGAYTWATANDVLTVRAVAGRRALSTEPLRRTCADTIGAVASEGSMLLCSIPLRATAHVFALYADGICDVAVIDEGLGGLRWAGFAGAGAGAGGPSVATANAAGTRLTFWPLASAGGGGDRRRLSSSFHLSLPRPFLTGRCGSGSGGSSSSGGASASARVQETFLLRLRSGLSCCVTRRELGDGSGGHGAVLNVVAAMGGSGGQQQQQQQRVEAFALPGGDAFDVHSLGVIDRGGGGADEALVVVFLNTGFGPVQLAALHPARGTVVHTARGPEGAGGAAAHAVSPDASFLYVATRRERLLVFDTFTFAALCELDPAAHLRRPPCELFAEQARAGAPFLGPTPCVDADAASLGSAAAAARVAAVVGVSDSTFGHSTRATHNRMTAAGGGSSGGGGGGGGGDGSSVGFAALEPSPDGLWVAFAVASCPCEVHVLRTEDMEVRWCVRLQSRVRALRWAEGGSSSVLFAVAAASRLYTWTPERCSYAALPAAADAPAIVPSQICLRPVGASRAGATGEVEEEAPVMLLHDPVKAVMCCVFT